MKQLEFSVKLTLSAILAFLLSSVTWAAKPTNYPVQEFRIGIADFTRNINITGFSAGSALNSWGTSGSPNEKWYLEWKSDKVFVIVNSRTDLAMTDNNGKLVLQNNTGASNQQFKIECSEVGKVQSDDRDYCLYHKIVSNANNNSAVTFKQEDNTVVMSAFNSNNIYQKFRLELDGLEGYAATAKINGKLKGGTIGGLLGKTVVVSNLNDLISNLDKKEPMTVVLNADIDLWNQARDKQRIRDNKTLVGSFSKNTLYDSQLRNNDFNSRVTKDPPSDNIVIKNINFVARKLNNTNSGVILLSIYSGRNIWIDHNSFTATYQQCGGDTDVCPEVGKMIWINTPSMGWSDDNDNGRNPDYITISYNYFTNRYWTFAYGSQNQIRDRIHSTIMFNRWEQTSRRTPQVSNGYFHIYNDFHTNFNSGKVAGVPNEQSHKSSQIIAGEGARLYTENNLFEGYSNMEMDIDQTGTVPSFYLINYGSKTTDKPANAPKDLTTDNRKRPLSWNWSGQGGNHAFNPQQSYCYTLLKTSVNNGTDISKFTKKYSGSFNSYDKLQYITNESVSTEYSPNKIACPYLKDIVTPTNQSPVVAITAPVNNKIFMPGEAIEITATATDPDGSVAKVEFYNGTSKLGEDASAPYTFSWTNAPDGKHAITAKATDNKGGVGTSSVVNITVAANIGSGKYIENLYLFDPTGKASWSIQPSVEAGDSVNGDRANIWETLPSSLANAEYIRTAIDPKDATTKEQASFKTKEAVTVFVLLDSRVIEPTNGDAPRALPAWLTGWAKSAEKAIPSNDIEYYVYHKDFAKGATVTLGTNITTQSVLNYVVAVNAQDNPSNSSSSTGNTDPSSSSGTETDLSSSSEGSTPILNTPASISNSATLQYYNLRGESLGTAKPTKAGIYLIKQGSSVQKIVVK